MVTHGRIGLSWVVWGRIQLCRITMDSTWPHQTALDDNGFCRSVGRHLGSHRASRDRHKSQGVAYYHSWGCI